MSGKTCVVTGANGGIGKEISRCLAKQGATVVLVCRDESRGLAAVADLKNSTGSDRLELFICDLSSLTSVRACANELRRSHDKLNVLVNSAAVFVNKRNVTTEGFEMMFATNYLGPFLFTNLLLDLLKAGAPSRIITLSAPSTTKLDFDDLNGEKKFGPLHAFGASKMADLLFTYYMATRLEGTGVTANVLFPGVTKTGLMKNAPAIVRLFVRSIAKRPEIPGEAGCYLASAGELEKVTGRFFKRKRESDSNAYSRDPAVQKKLWDIGVRLSGLP